MIDWVNTNNIFFLNIKYNFERIDDLSTSICL